MNLNTMVQIFVSQTVAGSVIIIFLLILSLLPVSIISSKWRYNIGKMAVVFFLLPLPLLIKWILSLLTANHISAPISETWSSNKLLILSQEFIPSISVNIAIPFICIWGVGALVYGGWNVYCYRKFLMNLQQTSSPVSKNTEIAKQVELIKKSLEIKSNVRLFYTTTVQSPFLVGLRKPTIYLPKEFSSNVDLSMIIHHELVHLKQNDSWVKAFILFANTLQWFNPLIYILRKNIYLWSEYACDEIVVQEMSYDKRKKYGETILNTIAGLEGLPVRFFSALSSDANQLQRRLSKMLNVKKLKKHTIIISLAVMTFVGIVGTYTAVLASSKIPKINISSKSEGIDNFSNLNKEVETISIEEATNQQIHEFQNKFGDSTDSELLPDAEEDLPVDNEIDVEEMNEIEAKEIIFIDVDRE